MSAQITNPQSDKKKKPWTLMFFFASDNTLSPSTLPQIKAIKAAGPSEHANVLVYFDPNEMGAPTRVFEINKGQEPASNSGDPVISVLSSDQLDPNDLLKEPGAETKKFAKSLLKSDGLQAFDALQQFLGFCRETYPAEHYMLFLLGHGLVVGRDAFLPDDNPDSAIGLKTLGEILNEFKKKIDGGEFDLIAMHSCSMSAVEVAYELKGTAKYMLASQGLAFVGSWPYRQLLTKIYGDIAAGAVNMDNLVKSLHSLCIKYSVDFMHAGYSSDMCLCSLDPERITTLSTPISDLAKALTDGVTDPRCRPLILLAHWRSQSYWQETYSDLYDFCLCLRQLCEQPKKDGTDEKDAATFKNREYDFKRFAIINACTSVMDTLKPENGTKGIGPIVCVDYVGPDVQYSHGLSIYFPWSR
ncbi:MAG TPA: clostripain-related cysteine peptidase, partial [Pyrinomonadaceae bacterium]|nr:clostripain-related cysteine peptidase [Pyrinomonadaceae bacterium]